MFFIVAGPWNGIEEEYERHGDLIWLDMDEIYATEISTLTFKTECFFSVLYEKVVSVSNSVKFLFKTDDDSYVDMDKLHYTLVEQEWGGGLDYWGKCKQGAKPHRNTVVPWQRKWFIPYEAYSSNTYPTYGAGAGYALSENFLQCAFGQQKKHSAQIWYMPNEDVAIGMLAERCNVACVNDDRIWLRYDKSRDHVNMDLRIIQHYVKSDEEMQAFHASTMI